MVGNEKSVKKGREFIIKSMTSKKRRRKKKRRRRRKKR